MHQHVARGDQRHAELAPRGPPFREESPIVAAAQQLRREPNAAAEALREPTAVRVQRLALDAMLVRNPENYAARIREAVGEILAACEIRAFLRRAPRSADQPAKRAVRQPVDRKHDDLETVREHDLATDDKLEPGFLRCTVCPNHACDRALVRQCEPGVTELDRRGHELGRMGRAAQEREITEAVELCVLHFGVRRSGSHRQLVVEKAPRQPNRPCRYQSKLRRSR